MQFMTDDYLYLVKHIVPGPQSASYFIQLCVPLVALSFPPSLLSHRSLCTIFIPLIIASNSHAWITMRGVDVISVDSMFRVVTLIGLRDSRCEFTRLQRHESSVPVKPDGKETASRAVPTITYERVPYPLGQSLLPRITWVADLLRSTLRFVDWEISEPAHDRRQPFVPYPAPTQASHMQFVVYSTVRGCIGYLLFDLAAFLARNDPYFTDTSVAIWTAPEVKHSPLLSSLHFHTFATVSRRSLLTAANIFLLISQQIHFPLAFLTILVALGLLPNSLSPLRMPPPFGPVTKLLDFGLRGFWSSFWHQTLRFPASGTGHFIASSLVGRESYPVTYSTLYTVTAFSVSGLVHVGLVPAQPLYATISPNAIRTQIFGFFVAQAFGLLLETASVGLISQMASISFRESSMGFWLKRIAYGLWIIGWSMACFPLLADATRQLGYYRVHPLPFSIVDWACGGPGWSWNHTLS